MYLHAESVKVDSDEGRITLEVETDEGDHLTVNIHSIDLDAFYDSVKGTIGPYLRERDVARVTYPSPDAAFYQVSGEPYELNDPKHENFHSIHADIYDNREKV